MYKELPVRRYGKTLEMLKKYAPAGCRILDLGVKNPFSEIMRAEGYEVVNTKGEDLDMEYKNLRNEKADFVTALEILEHLVNPFEVMRNLPCDKALVTVPLRLWFSGAYKNKNDARDCHYHEFEAWQLDMLLEKAGWEIVYRRKWTHPVKKVGIRPLLRLFTPRYYGVIIQKK